MNVTRWALATGDLLMAGLLAVAAGPTDERPAGRPDARVLPPVEAVRVDLEVLVDGQPLRTVYHAGRTYLPVPRLETEYEIRVWNRGFRRITAIVSVDGLSVINGQPASEVHPGYIVDPHSYIVIKGWRRNLETVAAFRFVDREKSYAYLMGRGENVGVIGLIAIEEKDWHPRPILEQKDHAKSDARRVLSAVGGTGTGYGRDVDSAVYYVPFIRSANKRTITLYYDKVDTLRKAGVPVDSGYPVPFPGSSEFVPPPPGDRDR
jgi:hypothetical protein